MAAQMGVGTFRAYQRRMNRIAATDVDDHPATAVFEVVGCHRDDPHRLLLLGDDRRYYQQALPDGSPIPVDPGDDWLVDRRPRSPQVAA